MPARPLAAALLAAAALPLSACVESDMRIALRADGSGTVRAESRFTEKAAQAIWRLRKADPSGDIAKEFEKNMYRPPDEALTKELAGLGLRLVEGEMKMEEKVLSSKYALEFRRVEALRHGSRIQGVMSEDLTTTLRLTRDAGGVHTLALRMTGGATLLEEAGEEESAGDEQEEPDPAVMQAVFAALGELMGESDKLKLRLALEVPGTVVDFRPAASGKKDGSRVAWELDLAGLMAIGMESAARETPVEGDEADPPGAIAFSVSFRLPEGVSLPEDALWSGPPKKDAEAPKPAGEGGEGKPPAPPQGPVPPAPVPPPPKDE